MDVKYCYFILFDTVCILCIHLAFQQKEYKQENWKRLQMKLLRYANQDMDYFDIAVILCHVTRSCFVVKRRRSMLCFMSKTINNVAPMHLTDIFALNKNSHSRKQYPCSTKNQEVWFQHNTLSRKSLVEHFRQCAQRYDVIV